MKGPQTGNHFAFKVVPEQAGFVKMALPSVYSLNSATYFIIAPTCSVAFFLGEWTSYL
jgi:hypothetical protein